MENVQPKVNMDQVALWVGESVINFKLAQEQIRTLTAENLRLNAALGKCKCKGEKGDKDI